MSLTWPWALAALLGVPLLLVVRWWAARRRRRTAVRVASIALIRAALPGPSRWRRRLPALLFLAGLLSLGVATARPQASMAVPTNSTSILLALDVSTSMCSTDVEPDRLTAAQAAAREFITTQDDGTRIGLVAFSGIAGLLVPPTSDHGDLLAAIDELTTARGTAIGMAILTSIDAIADVNSAVAPTGVDPAVDAAVEQPDTIVVLTDGANSQGVDPVTAAEQAAARGVRVYTIGFGTTEPAPMVCRANQVQPGAAFGGGERFRGSRLQQIDEPTLQEVAELTGGEYFRAEDAEQLTDVLTGLPASIELQRRPVEITVWFVLAAMLLTALAVALSLRWNPATALPVVTPAARRN
ncbi:VWA domain-containing protein [Micromonospora endophytica]|uniref:Uncharacterized protein n=1 Tax=Micromonospora endophytica TaxID=515350 RepID=A0A2W2CSJ1_9ACTN|nr:VWA domain-containing protein [Micromonospora endophytica]PZF96194.1 hypothetical protein C1I93_14340 [Micromonospora endophytica]RIW43504.1 VWA domain-containing protein [Micromonospora endophytica]BCJ62866.1 aerotolerance regulator BatA [Micromonospora endophytica]